MDAKHKAKSSVLRKLIEEMSGMQTESLRAKSPNFAKKSAQVEEVEAEEAPSAPTEEEDETEEGKAALLKMLAEMGE